MKRIKYLFVLVFAVCLLSTVAFADGLVVSDPVYDGTNVIIEFMYEGEVGEPISFSGIIKPEDLSAFDGPSTTADFNTCKWNAGPKRVNLSITGGEANKKYTITMVPIGNPVGQTLNFSSWIVNTTAGNISLVPSSAFAKTVKAAAAEPTIVTDIAADSAEYVTVNGAENSYWGVWVAKYTVNAGGKKLIKAKVDFAADSKSFETEDLSALNIEGEGDVSFDIAIIGVPEASKDGSLATATLQ